ncbi:MAG: twin-arginine translocation signal domain-containing protein, partial [Armatimonadetes bacterium]|nr:twin-arginine translocation signal domain-containing protein [Armatimonadota bacterium]
MSENVDRGEQGQDCSSQETTSLDRVVSRRQFMKLAGVAGAGLALAGGLGEVLAACGSDSTTTTGASSTTAVTAGSTTTGAT